MWLKMFLDKHTLILSDVAVKQILDRYNMEGLVKPVIIYKYNSEELMKPCDFSTATEFDMSVDEKSCDKTESTCNIMITEEELVKPCDFMNEGYIEVNSPAFILY